MNGAESLVRTLVGGGVNVCFSNPGTSEMHFVAALDRVDGMRCVLALFEGVATGAADGYARMAEKTAATLLHLGPGLANGLANLHNASKASTPVVNIVGDHATYHRNYNSPLTSDIETAAKPFSGWVKTSPTAQTVAEDGAAAIAAATQPPGQGATLIPPGLTARAARRGGRRGGDRRREAAARTGRDPNPPRRHRLGRGQRPGEGAAGSCARKGERGRREGGRACTAVGRTRPAAAHWARAARKRPGAGGAHFGQDRLPDAGADLQPPHGARGRARLNRSHSVSGRAGAESPRRRQAHRAGRQPHPGGVFRLPGQRAP